MTAKVNVARILAAMNAKKWGRKDTCVNCGINGKTLDRILDKGEIPRRIDVFWRLCGGLGLSVAEAVINPPNAIESAPAKSSKPIPASGAGRDKDVETIAGGGDRWTAATVALMAADHALASLLAYREGISDELLISVRAAIQKALDRGKT
jgi:hypothetical protein